MGHRSPLGFSLREGSSGALPAPRNLQGGKVALLKWTAKGKRSLSHPPPLSQRTEEPGRLQSVGWQESDTTATGQ